MIHYWIEDKKIFNRISSVFFYLSLLVILIQTVGYGLKLSFIDEYYIAFKIINFVFGIFSVFVSIYLYLKETEIIQKLVKGGFIGISFFYLIASFQWLIDQNFLPIDARGNVIFFSIFIGFLSISQKLNSVGNLGLHSALIFVLSFIMLILSGSFLLLLPAATTNGISIIDAVFTITSGVTVTGLTVVDTNLAFSTFGKSVIMIFIQMGGLGILTFTNLFSLLFKTDHSFQNRMMVSEMIKELNSKDTFTTLMKIVSLTIVIELIGALLIYISVYDVPQIENKVFFSAFHAISAFCNAGFSTLTNNLYEESIRFNYFLQMIIAWLLVTGGISYSVMINHNNIFTNKIKKFVCYITNTRKKEYLTKMSNNNSLVITTTFWLLLAGTIMYYFNEYNNTLKDHGFWGKILVSVFNSATPRTAGFNNVDMTMLTTPTIMVTLFLMWVGASPGSTGGGIKTTTFAVSVLNLFNQIKGRTRLVYNWREISIDSINQVNAVILLSFIAIGTSTLLLSYFEPNMLFRNLLFEVVSAYSTVGLSLGITASLSEPSKMVLIATMFLGRVSFLTFLIGLYRQFFKEHKRELANYPSDNIFIN
ncbi:MAG: potassium transporter TrkG [Saprospiraceae bacterium]|jgi:potassium uptake TrkH family protein